MSMLLGAMAGFVVLAGLFWTVERLWLANREQGRGGPFRYVIASPVFHRWHHTTEKEGIDKNFAGLLPLWDLLFGTCYMPRGVQPMVFGVVGEPVPEGIWRQLVYPLRPGARVLQAAQA